MAAVEEENQVDLQDLCDESFDATTIFRHAPRVAPFPGVHVEFQYAEHGFIGDTITLQLPDDKCSLGAEYPFTLPNGLTVTYGEINGLAGDCYGTDRPISDGTTAEDQGERFQAAYATLAQKSKRQPKEANHILKVLREEVNALNEAVRDGIDPSQVYATLPNVTWELLKITRKRPKGQPSYIGLMLQNWDHYGADARTAYNAGHTAALQQATQSRDPQNLLTAYSMNAFADHFLGDSFAAGHTRTPRRHLHSKTPVIRFADLCSLLMHDEDNAIGLDVVNPSGSKWHMYGDKRLLDKANFQNRELVTKAIQASADEIFQAWSTQQTPALNDYEAWRYAPTLESARAETQELAPLFTFEDPPQRRLDIHKRREWQFTSDFKYLDTLNACHKSGLWHYPITLGP